MKVRYEFASGMFLLCAMLIFGLSIWTLGREKEVFSSLEEFHSSFGDVKGLSPGAPVRLGGITVGRVDSVGFSPDFQDSRVHVKFLVNADYLERVKADSRVSIETQGLLGDRFLSISLGSDIKQALPGASLQSVESGDLAEILSKAGQVVDNTVKISENINQLSGKLKSETIDHLTSAVDGVAQVMKELKSGDGLLHRLIYSKEDGDKIIGTLDRSSRDIRAITREIRSGDGLLNALIFGKDGQGTVEALRGAALNLGNTATHISDLATEIKEGSGMAHHLFFSKSPNGFNDIIVKLNETAENLRAASEALSNGSGTLGALLVDSNLYDNLVEVTDGAKRSFILREAIRSSLKR